MDKLVGKQKELDADGSGDITGKDFALLRKRNKKQEGGEMAMPPELATDLPPEVLEKPSNHEFAINLRKKTIFLPINSSISSNLILKKIENIFKLKNEN